MGRVCVRGGGGVGGWSYLLGLLFTFVLACSVKKKKNIIIETLGQAHKLTRSQLTPRTQATLIFLHKLTCEALTINRLCSLLALKSASKLL